LAASLEQSYNVDKNNLDEARIQTDNHLLNLLVIRNDGQDVDGLRSQLRGDFFDYDTSLCPQLDIDRPAVPLICDGLDEAYQRLLDLDADTSDALCFGHFVKGIVDAACGDQHIDRIDQLNSEI
jgi:hypothetical protein